MGQVFRGRAATQGKWREFAKAGIELGVRFVLGEKSEKIGLQWGDKLLAAKSAS